MSIHVAIWFVVKVYRFNTHVFIPFLKFKTKMNFLQLVDFQVSLLRYNKNFLEDCSQIPSL